MASVRRIRADEWALLRELRLRALEDAPEAFGQTLDDARARPDEEWTQAARQGSAGDSRVWLIAEADANDGATAARPVGIVQARRRPPDDVMIFSMWVDTEARRRGVGRLLIEAVERWAASWGGRRMVLWVFPANEGAVRFYERIGFTVDPDGPDAESGRSYGALAMSREVAARGS